MMYGSCRIILQTEDLPSGCVTGMRTNYVKVLRSWIRSRMILWNSFAASWAFSMIILSSAIGRMFLVQLRGENK